MDLDSEMVGCGDGRAGGALPPSRREIVVRQLARSDQHWSKALVELREGLIGMAAEMDELEQRVRLLETRGEP